MTMLLPCPFCGNELGRKTGRINPMARCITEGCIVAEKMSVVNLDDSVEVERWNTRAKPAAAPVMQPMNLAPKDQEIIGQDTDGRIFNLRWDPDDCGENWYDVHGDQMAYPVRWMPMPTEETK